MTEASETSAPVVVHCTCFRPVHAFYCAIMQQGDKWRLPCGCLRNEAGAHRVGCPDYPEGRR